MADEDGGEPEFPAKLSPQPQARRSDVAIAALASEQHGVVTLAQLVDLGLSARAVRDRAAGGRLRRVHRGVYAVHPLSDEGRWMAAVLACAEHAVLSHRSAAALWGLCASRIPVDVTVAQSGRRPRDGLTVHEAALSPADTAVRNSIPCTALPRTLLDLAATTNARTLERAIDRAEELRAFDLDAIRELLARNRGARGAGALATAIAAFDDGTTTASPAEERFLALIRRHGIPAPEVNAWLPLPEGDGYRPDILWRDERLIVEVDGRAHHARRKAFEHDRKRDRRLALAGFETRRYAATEVRDAPDRVANEVRAFLALRASEEEDRLRG